MNRVTLEFPSFQDFLDNCSPFISEAGMFLRTSEVQAVGSEVGFEVGLGDDFPILRGAGEVIWVVEKDAAGIGAPGMAVRYTSTDDASQRLIRKIAERHREQTGEVFELERPSAAPESAQAAQPLDVSGAEEASAEVAPAEPEVEAPDAAESDVLTLPDAEPDLELDRAAAEARPADQPAPAVLPPGLEEAMEEAEAPARGGRTWLWLAVAGLAAAALGFWQHDFLAEKLGMGPGDEAAPTAAEAPLETVDVADQDPSTAAGEEEAEPEAAEPVATLEPEGTEAEAPPPAPPVERGPLTRIEDISWLSGEGSTLLMLRADGSFGEDGYQVETLGGDSPRAILKIAGVTQPYAAGSTDVGTAEIRRVRTGLHPGELHVVLDLASAEAQVVSTEVDGVVLQVRVSTGAAP